MITRRWSNSEAFTLIEILIVVVILGILAAIVIPQFTKASEDAQVGNVETQLQTIRSQIELYRVKNNGQYPTFSFGTANDFGDPAGATALARGLRGNDYLKTNPLNPRTNTATIIAGTAATANAPAAAGAAGWVWDGAGGFFCNGFNEDFRNPANPATGVPWPQ